MSAEQASLATMGTRGKSTKPRMRLSDDRGGRGNMNQEDKITKGRLNVHRAGGGTSQGKAHTHEDTQRQETERDLFRESVRPCGCHGHGIS